jgi:hypothetical protein
MGVRYYKAVSSKPRTQSVQRRRAPYVKMSQEARSLLNIRRHKAAVRFQQDIDVSHEKFLETAASIAGKHGKSFQNVQFSLHRGRSGLTRQYRKKTTAWNAWIWKQARVTST